MFTEDGDYQRSTYGHQLSVRLPGEGDLRQDADRQIAGFSTIDGGPYPSSSSGPIHTVSNVTTMVRGRHTFKAGISFEYSGEDDFDQINVNATPGGTNNQNGLFDFTDDAAPARRPASAVPNTALGLFTNYAELGQRNFTKWRSLATDVFVQDSWKPRDNLTVEGGVRWVYWPPWYSTTNNIANFDPRFYDVNNQAVMSPSTGRLVSGPRYNGVVLPGDGFEGDAANSPLASDPAVAGALPRRAARLLGHARQRLRAAPRASRGRPTRRRWCGPAPACSTTASR